MKKLLLAFDGSVDNEKNLEWGLNFAKQAAAKTVIVKLIEPFEEIATEGQADFGGPSIGRHFAHSSRSVMEKVVKYFGENGLSATTTIIDGDPSADLILCAEREQVDMIICGTGEYGASGGLDQRHRYLASAEAGAGQFMVYSLRAIVAN